MTLPITVVIATRNRWPELRVTLAGLRGQGASGVVVVDNASDDGTPAGVAAEFPEVQLLRLSDNLGVPAVGAGLAAVKTPYGLLLDDDALPDGGCLAAVVSAFASDPLVAVVACHVQTPDGIAMTAGWPENPVCFWGCGAGVRMSAISPEPYVFDPRLRLHGTEMDLAIRLYSRNLTIRYARDAVVVHRVSALNRSDAMRIRYLTSAAVWFPLKHLPTPMATLLMTRHLTLLAARAIKRRTVCAYLHGLLEAAGALGSVLRERRVVSATVAAWYRAAVWEYEPISERILRSFTSRPAPRALEPVTYASVASRHK